MPSAAPSGAPVESPNFQLEALDEVEVDDAGPEILTNLSKTVRLEDLVLTVDEPLKPTPEVEGPRTPPPRYANVECIGADGANLVSAQHLPQDRGFALRIGIGELKRSSLVQDPKPFPDDMVPPDIYLDVIVTSGEFEVAPPAGGAFSTSAQGLLFLPGRGEASRGPDGKPHIDFPMRIPVAGEASCRIVFQYRGAIIQSLLLTKESEVDGGTGAFAVHHDYSLSSQPSELARVPKRDRLALLAAARKEGFNQLFLYPRDGDVVPGRIFDLDIGGLTATIRNLRTALEDRAPTQRRRSKRELERDLQAIAPFGAELFQQLPGQNLSALAPLFKDPENTVIHVAYATSAEFVAPWSLIYDIPLTVDKPRICEIVSNWDETGPLVDPAARSCPHGPHDENVLCPFGFWGLRYTIEQLVSTERPSTEIVLDKTSQVVAAQTLYGVDKDKVGQHMAKLQAIFSRRVPGISMPVGSDKQTIRRLMGQDLPFLYFYCHGERETDSDPNVYLGVGNREAITTLEFGNWLWAWFRNQNLKVWDKNRPLVFINACNSAAIYPETLISYVNAFIGRAEAAGVIGTEVKVSQSLAMEFAESFFTKLLTEGSTVDTALREVRMEFLADGNLFGLVYTAYCWADLHVVTATGPITP